jgi:hypothetical protein
MDTGKGIAGGGAATRGASASSSISNLLVVDANPEVVGRDEIEQLLDVGNGRKLFQRGSCMEAPLQFVLLLVFDQTQTRFD